MENFEVPDFEAKYAEGKFRLAWRLCIILASLFTVMAFIEFFHSIANGTLYLICASIPGLELVYLYKTKNSRIAYLSLCSFGSVLTAVSLHFFINEVHLGDFIWMALISIMAFWGLGNFWGWFFTVLNFLISLSYFFFSMKTNFEVIRPIDFTLQASLAVEIMAAYIAIAAIVSQFVKYYRYSFESVLSNNLVIKESNRIISSKNEENIILMKEVHHRVKNNLQIITSLLRLQKQTMPEDAQPKFEEAINRIMTMSLIHRKLYQSGDFTRIEIGAYINDLIREIVQSHSVNDNVKAEIKSEYNKIGLNSIVPLGLIINELLSNSFKHAFSKGQSGAITVEISGGPDNTFYLKYSDTGVWIEEDREGNSFGLDLIATLTEQLDGSFTRSGSSYHFTFNNQDSNA